MTSGGRAPTSRRRLYLDTSAYLGVLLGEPDADRLADETAGAQLLSIVLLVLEARRTLVRLAREGALTPDQYELCLDHVARDADVFMLRDLTLDLCQSPVLPPVFTPRSLDLAHLRTALWFQSTDLLDWFVTMDAVQQRAARELGLPV